MTTPPETCKTCGCKLGHTVKTPIDSSLAFTALLEMWPATLYEPQAGELRDRLLRDWYASRHLDFWAYAREWIEANGPCWNGFCTLQFHPGDPHHVDVTGHGWDQPRGTAYCPACRGYHPAGDCPRGYDSPVTTVYERGPEGERQLAAALGVPDSSEARETFCSTCGHLDTPGVHLFAECPRFNACKL